MKEKFTFEVLGTMTNEVSFDDAITTYHYSKERVERHNRIMSTIGGGKLIASFEVYTAHPNGNEIHNIFDNGVILIQNIRTKRVVTELIARPQQIKRYWEYLYKPIPIEVYAITLKAKEHQIKGYNNW